MKILYSFLSVLLTLLILLECALLDVVVSHKAINEIFKLVNREFFGINIIFFVFMLAFLCSFVIIFLLYKRKSSKYIVSSLFASGVAIVFFTLFFSGFDIVKNFYFASNEFSELVKSSLKNIAITNFSLGILLIVVTIIYFIRRRKDEKEF